MLLHTHARSHLFSHLRNHSTAYDTILHYTIYCTTGWWTEAALGSILGYRCPLIAFQHDYYTSILYYTLYYTILYYILYCTIYYTIYCSILSYTYCSGLPFPLMENTHISIPVPKNCLITLSCWAQCGFTTDSSIFLWTDIYTEPNV